MAGTFDRSNQTLDTASTTAATLVRVTQAGLEKVLTLDATGIAALKGGTNGIGYVTGTGGAATEASNAVTLSKLGGTITTSSLTTAAGLTYVITVTNTLVVATDVPVCSIKAYAGAGTPLVTVTAVADGSFVIKVFNLHASAALNAAMTINFAIFRSVAA